MSDNFNGLFAQQGWQCPICKRVYSPFTQMCLYCGNTDVITTNELNKIKNECLTVNLTDNSFAPVKQTLNEYIEQLKQNKL